MGKRSSFDRKDKDFYETPENAVSPLIPHLSKKSSFIDPCSGNGVIGEHLRSLGCNVSAWRNYDISPMDYSDCNSTYADARTEDYGDIYKMFLTNPPWSRDALHPIINNLASQNPTWLLFDADWMHTKQSAEYMKYCVKVVSIGRVKWFPDSKSVGKDNCCWYLFDKNFTGQTTFYGR